MIKDHTIDQCLVELARTMAALKALRAERKAAPIEIPGTCKSCYRVVRAHQARFQCGSSDILRGQPPASRQHAAALRASLDLTRKLADLRQGR